MNVLFVCRGNVQRSQTAAAYLHKLAPEHTVTSAGTAVADSEPTVGERAKHVPAAALAIEVMKEDGIDLTDAPRTQLTEELAAAQDLIIYMTTPKETPAYLKKNKAAVYWDVPDPRELPAEGVRKTRDTLKAHVTQLAKLLS